LVFLTYLFFFEIYELFKQAKLGKLDEVPVILQSLALSVVKGWKKKDIIGLSAHVVMRITVTLLQSRILMEGGL